MNYKLHISNVDTAIHRPLEREQLCGVDVERLVLVEALRLDVVAQLDRHVEVAEGAEDLVNLANLERKGLSNWLANGENIPL